MKKKQRIIIAACSLLLVLAACSPKTPTPSAEKIQEAIAQTVAVNLTKTAVARPSDTPTPLPSPTPLPLPTDTPIPTQAEPTPAMTATAPMAAGGLDKGDWASSSPQDGATVSGSFDVVVKIMNTGTSTWTTDYGIAYVSGTTFGISAPIKVGYPVPPQAMAEFKLKFTAPEEAGKHRSDWRIYNAAGNTIGVFYFEYNTD